MFFSKEGLEVGQFICVSTAWTNLDVNLKAVLVSNELPISALYIEEESPARRHQRPNENMFDSTHCWRRQVPLWDALNFMLSMTVFQGELELTGYRKPLRRRDRVDELFIGLVVRDVPHCERRCMSNNNSVYVDDRDEYRVLSMLRTGYKTADYVNAVLQDRLDVTTQSAYQSSTVL